MTQARGSANDSGAKYQLAVGSIKSPHRVAHATTVFRRPAARAVATRADNPLIDDPFAEPLVRAVGIDFFTRWAAGNIKATDVDDPDGTWGLQRLADLLAARTRYFDAFFRDATSAGIRQAVILASGLDARAYR